ncbi:MAG: hypothetical protein CW338_00265 [Clostridiales bacterium]|nr:hypothetical protein [Clostridiales bacterium]
MFSLFGKETGSLLYLEFFVRLLIASLFGAAIGYERGKRSKGAGIRTHFLVCCAAALMMIVSKYAFFDITANDEGIRGADAARIAAQVVTGVSFLGAGVIYKQEGGIRGLTTAAGIWITAGIGLAVGAGMYILGIMGTALVVVLQVLMHRFPVGMDGYASSHLHFTVRNIPAFREEMGKFLDEHKAHVFERKEKFLPENMYDCDIMIRSRIPITYKQVDELMEKAENVTCVEYTPIL